MIDLEAGLGVALGFLLGIVGHEFVTHLVAASLGDPAPRFQRRITFDLRRHADPLGTYVAPALFTTVALLGANYLFAIGYGRSHAIGSAYQRGNLARTVLVPLTGPATTLLLATVIGRTLASPATSLGQLFISTTVTLLFLTAIELLPIPGRDGGRVLSRFLPPHAAMKMEELRQYEAVFLIGIYLLFPGVVVNIASALGGIALG